MSTRDLRAQLQQAERVYDQTALTAEAERRIRNRLEPTQARSSRGRWRLAIPALALPMAAVVLAVILIGSRAPSTLGGFQIVDSSSELRAIEGSDHSIELAGGRCTLLDNDEGITVAVADHARVRKESDGVRILAGVAEIQVRKRPATSRPAQVLVSGGAIQILGTKFRVEQSADGGSVVLHEGRIRFVSPDGRIVSLTPGQSLAWPLADPATNPQPAAPALPSAPAPAPLPSRPPPRVHVPSPPRSEPPPDDAEAVLRDVAVERSRGRYDEAVRILTSALDQHLRPATRERLSFELGSILTHQFSDHARACAHWAAHMRAFPAGRYDLEIAQARKSLDCQQKESR